MSPEGFVLVAEMYANQEINLTAIVEHVQQASGLKDFTVAVFYCATNQKRYRAYTLWYNPRWPGCCLHEVSALDGAGAKRQAIKDCKREHQKQ